MIHKVTQGQFEELIDAILIREVRMRIKAKEIEKLADEIENLVLYIKDHRLER